MTSGTPNLNRRDFLTYSGLAATGLLTAGCAQGTNKNSGPADSNALSTASWDDQISDLLNKAIGQAFEKETGVKIEPQASVPFDDYQTRFRTLLAGGVPPDVMRLNDDFLTEVSDKKLSHDLAPFFEKSGLKKADFFPIFDWSRLTSGQRGLVVATQVRCIYYNKTMFKEAGVPLPPTDWTSDGWTWDDFLEAAKALTKGTEQYGASIVQDTGYEDSWTRNNGGEGVFSEDGRKFTLADAAGVEAVQWVADLTVKHHVQPSWGDLTAEGADQRLFTAGKLAMAEQTSSNIGYYNTNVKDFEWDLAPMPARKHQYQQGSVVLYIIPSEAKNADLAWDYLDYAISEERGRMLAEAGLAVPVNKKAAESLKSPGEFPTNMDLLVQGAEQNQIVNATKASTEAVALYRPQLQRVYTGEVSAKQALSDIRGQVEAAIAG